MGHGNNTKVDPKPDIAAARVKTPGEQLLEDQSAKTLGWAAKGDYTNPHEGGLFVNYADPAMRNRNRELTMNAGNQGVSALGPVDPNYLATVKENIKAHQAEGDSAQYEQDVKEGVGDAAAVAGKSEGLDISRKLGVVGASTDLYKYQDSKPKWWQYLSQGVAGGVTAALA